MPDTVKDQPVPEVPVVTSPEETKSIPEEPQVSPPPPSESKIEPIPEPKPELQSESSAGSPPEMAEPSNSEEQALLEQQAEQEMNDPMMQAIQHELGQTLMPSGGGFDPLQEQILQTPYTENEVFRAVNLTRAYGEGAAYIEVIKGISFIVNQGEYVVIYGQSGSGKTTLINLLAGLEIPTRGEIRIRNQPFAALTDDDIALYHREGVGLVFQSFNLLESLTAWENVAFPLMLSGAPKEWRKHEALKMLDRFGLVDFANHYPNQLSGGQQQRVSLGRALIHDPELLLIDEPTGNLDSKSADIVVQEIARLHKQEGRTIILVTHSQVFLPFATRVFYIRDGALLTSNEQSRLDSVH